MQLKSGDDTMDILGFLAFVIVRVLCANALLLKQNGDDIVESSRLDGTRRRTDIDAAATCSLFLPAGEPQTALQPDHIRAAFVSMQRKGRQKAKVFSNFRGGFVKNDVVLI